MIWYDMIPGIISYDRITWPTITSHHAEYSSIASHYATSGRAISHHTAQQDTGATYITSYYTRYIHTRSHATRLNASHHILSRHIAFFNVDDDASWPATPSPWRRASQQNYSTYRIYYTWYHVYATRQNITQDHVVYSNIYESHIIALCHTRYRIIPPNIASSI